MKIARLRKNLKATAKYREDEAEELRDVATKWELLIWKIFQLPSLDRPENVDVLLMTKVRSGVDRQSRNVGMFDDAEILGFCVHTNLKAPFGVVAVSSRTRETFWGATVSTVSTLIFPGLLKVAAPFPRLLSR